MSQVPFIEKLAKHKPKRKDYAVTYPITTRWMDNDVYGHVNNVTYYSYFDTITNTFLIEKAGLDIHKGSSIGYIVQSECFYHSAISYPDKIDGAFKVLRIGNSSVLYGVAIFKQGEDIASAHGTMTHVFVDRETETPKKIEGDFRQALESALI
ncbi:MAG: acyl-CoA thioester hydrolase [Bermanella sp.]|jgi:acyl-CoA thioester hydrolase